MSTIATTAALAAALFNTALAAALRTTALAAALFAGAAPPALAKAPRARPPAPERTGSRFYPQEIEGGVSGNYSFNNQIRKLKDPLNANGGK